MEPLVIAQIVVQSVQDVLFAVAAGALVCGAMLARADEVRRSASAGLGRTRLGALAVLAIACLLYLWLEAAVMGGTSFHEASPAVSAVLTQSHFGLAWLAGFAGVVLACLGGTSDNRPARRLAAVGMFAYVAGKAAASHAADAGDFTLREAVHVVHLGATALWAGSVIVAAAVLRRWDDTRFATAEQRLAFCTELSQLATFALGVVIVTGIYNVTQDTAVLSAPLLSVLYGRLLTLKLVFVTLAVLLGGYNRMIHLPHLRTTAADGGALYRDAQRSFDRLLAVEAAAMLMVLAVAGVLGHTSPSGG